MALTAPQIIDRGATGIVSSGLTHDDVITACEVAELLRCPSRPSTTWPVAGRSQRAGWGRTWRFLRPRIEAVLDS
jgi:hypothetical protein